MATNNEKILYKDLSYKLQGLFFDIRNDLGSGHKESIYQKALEKELMRVGIPFIKEASIKIYSQKGDFLGLYRPDFLAEGNIIIELKAVEHISRQEIARVYDYLRNSKYELAYLVNFASARLFMKRLIFANDRKTQIATNQNTKGNKFVAFRKPFRCHSWIILFVAISLLFVVISGVHAAELTLKKNFEIIGKDDTFETSLILNTENEAINALEVAINYSGNMKLESISDGNSIISLWIRKPTAENSKDGNMFLSGLIPGGLTIKEGVALTFTFKNLSEGRGYVLIKDAKVLRNDSVASEAEVRFKNLEFNIGGARTKAQAGEKLILDFLPPDEFKIYPSKDKNAFDNSWFISFNAQDKGSGINHYEIKESFLGIWGSWKEGDSPYVLSDQLLLSIIKVRAVDNVGWEREALFVPFRLYLIYGGLVILSVFLLIRAIKRYRSP